MRNKDAGRGSGRWDTLGIPFLLAFQLYPRRVEILAKEASFLYPRRVEILAKEASFPAKVGEVSHVSLRCTVYIHTWKGGRVNVAATLQEKIDKDKVLGFHSIVKRGTPTASILQIHTYIRTYVTMQWCVWWTLWGHCLNREVFLISYSRGVSSKTIVSSTPSSLQRGSPWHSCWPPSGKETWVRRCWIPWWPNGLGLTLHE